MLRRCQRNLLLLLVGPKHFQPRTKLLHRHFQACDQRSLALIEQVDLLPHVEQCLFAVNHVRDVPRALVDGPLECL
jgi:hypothetical protein